MDNILEKIYEFNKETNKFQYGLKFPHKNKIDHRDNTTYEDYKKYYKLASPEEFVKQDGGICWDFVTYEADWFKKNLPNIHYDCYFIIFNNGKDCHTHTFLVFNHNNKYYWFESSYYKFRGIYEADSVKDILNYVIYGMDKYSPKGESLLNYNFGVYKYNALDKNLYGLSDREYMIYICNHGSHINHTYSKNYNVRKVTMDNMNEAWLFNQKDIMYNIDRFVNLDDRDVNFCIIVGFSGSGKSTLGSKLAKQYNHTIHIELDDINTFYNIPKEVKMSNELYKAFISTVGKKYDVTYDYLCKANISEDEYELPLMRDFILFSMDYAKLNKNKRIILEGIWPLLYGMDPKIFKDSTVCILGLSYLASSLRQVNRDNIGLWNRIKDFTRDITTQLSDAKKINYNINKWIKYFSNTSMNEAYINNMYTIQRIDGRIYNKYKDQCKDLKHIDYKNDHAYILLDKSEWVGLVAVDTNKDDGNKWITAIVVNPSYRGKRISYQLLDFAINQFGANSLTVTKSNKVAIHAYEKIGFKIINQSKVDSGEDKRYIMKLVKYTNEACKDIATARQFVTDVDKLAKKYDANYFIVTDGASGVRNNGNPAVRNARLAQIKWEKNNNKDPNEDWSNKVNNGKYNESTINDINNIKITLSQKERDYISTNSRADPVYNYVHYVNGKPAGYIAVRVISRDDCTNAFIELAVHPKYRHKGIAKIMMDKAINDILNQYPDAYIHYNSYHDNKASIAFAEKYGLYKYSTDDKFERFVYRPSIHESLTSKERKAIPQKSFGIPEDRKFPLDSEQHVRSAIHLFGHAEESKKHALAKRILSAAHKYGINVPEDTQVYKYAHSAVKEDSVLLVEYNNDLKNLSLDRIHNWMLCESRFIDGNQIYYMSINEAINNLDGYNNIMYVFTNEYTLYSHSKGKPILIGQISILEDGSYEWLIQYPLVIDESKLLHNAFNELMAGSSINPVVGRNTGYIINTGQNLIYTMDPTSDRGLTVDDDNHLTLSDIPDEPIYELYQFIGPMGYVNRLNALYKNETTVDNVYTALCGDEYTENALSNNPLFRRIDLELLEQRMLSEIASFNRSIEELRNNVIVECNIIDTMITKPLFFSKYNKFNDISIKEDCDGYFFYSSLSNKRSVSVENISDLSEAMIQSIL